MFYGVAIVRNTSWRRALLLTTCLCSLGVTRLDATKELKSILQYSKVLGARFPSQSSKSLEQAAGKPLRGTMRASRVALNKIHLNSSVDDLVLNWRLTSHILQKHAVWKSCEQNLDAAIRAQGVYHVSSANLLFNILFWFNEALFMVTNDSSPAESVGVTERLRLLFLLPLETGGRNQHLSTKSEHASLFYPAVLLDHLKERHCLQ